MSASRMPVLTGGLLIAILSGATMARADDCAAIRDAMEATIRAPAMRQYFSAASAAGKERLMSVFVGDAVYMSAGPGTWRKMSRAEIMDATKQAPPPVYADCRRVGTETMSGVPAEIWAYRGLKDSVRVWIGGDGLLRKQETKTASMRYEFDSVRAPGP